MKLNAALAKSLLMAASIGMVVPVLADTTVVKSTDATTPPAKPGAPKPAAKTLAPKTGSAPAAVNTKAGADAAKKTAATPAATVKKDEPEPELKGMVTPRTVGGFFTLQIEAGKFKLSFYDKDKKPVTTKISRVAARWDSKKKISADHTVLNPSDDGKEFRGIGFVSPPYTFKLFLTFLDEEGKAVENYVVDMSPEAATG